MLTKNQKTWMWIFIAMFAIPEITFSFIISLIPIGMSPLYTVLINKQFFLDNPIYLLVSQFIELIGVLGLLYLSIKSKRKILSVLLSIVVLLLIFIAYVGFVVSFTMNL